MHPTAKAPGISCGTFSTDAYRRLGSLAAQRSEWTAQAAEADTILIRRNPKRRNPIPAGHRAQARRQRRVAAQAARYSTAPTAISIAAKSQTFAVCWVSNNTQDATPRTGTAVQTRKCG